MRSLRLTDSPLTVFVLFAVVYLCTLTSNFTAPHDSMAYLNMIKTGEGLWHPHHLLYHVTSKYWLQLWKPVFPSVEDYFLIESFSSVWGAGVLSFVFIFFRRRFELPVITSWLGTIVTGFSYAIWFYSVNVEVYMPALFFTVWSLYILTAKNWSSRQVWQIAIIHSLAILFHQMNILLIPVVLFKIFSQQKNIYVFKSIFWYGLTGLVLVGGTYFLGGWVMEGYNNFTDWSTWIRGYTETNAYWQPLSLKTPLLATMGFMRTIVGGQFLFHLETLNAPIGTFLSSHELKDEVFLVRNLSSGVVWTLIVLTVLLAALMLVLLIRFLGSFSEKMRTLRHIITPLLLYIGIYSLYFLFWMPEILEFWMGHSIICWLLIVGTYRPAGRKLNLITGTIAVLLFTINYTSSIRPMQDIENDIGYSRIEKVKENATARDLVIVEDPWLLKEFLEYYTPARVRVIPDKGFQQIALRLDVDSTLKEGHRIFVFPDNTADTTKAKSEFRAGLEKDYRERLSVFQTQPAVIWMIR